MTFCEYIENVCEAPLSDCQKKYLDQMEENLRNGCKIYMPPKLGRQTNICYTAALALWWREHQMEDLKCQ